MDEKKEKVPDWSWKSCDMCGGALGMHWKTVTHKCRIFTVCSLCYSKIYQLKSK